MHHAEEDSHKKLNSQWGKHLILNQACSGWGVACVVTAGVEATMSPRLWAAWTTIANRVAARAAASCSSNYKEGK